VGFVDWRTVSLGAWAHAVNDFPVSALDVPDRRAHERDPLGQYLKALASFGVSAPGRVTPRGSSAPATRT
jgi:hypothetical protein